MNTMKPFVAYLNCSIIYDGRARSILNNGNYIIVYKKDGSVSIHGSTLNTPKNYMGAGSKLTICDNVWKFERKKETITLTILSEHWNNNIDDWSDEAITMYRTEYELREKLINNLTKVVSGDILEVVKEYNTSFGPADLWVATTLNNYVFEVKRKKASVNAVLQLEKYAKSLGANGILVAPEISPKALSVLTAKGYGFFAIGFDGV